MNAEETLCDILKLLDTHKTMDFVLTYIPCFRDCALLIHLLVQAGTLSSSAVNKRRNHRLASCWVYLVSKETKWAGIETQILFFPIRKQKPAYYQCWVLTHNARFCNYTTSCIIYKSLSLLSSFYLHLSTCQLLLSCAPSCSWSPLALCWWSRPAASNHLSPSS